MIDDKTKLNWREVNDDFPHVRSLMVLKEGQKYEILNGLNWRESSKEKPKGKKPFYTVSRTDFNYWKIDFHYYSEARYVFKSGNKEYWIYEEDFEKVLPPLEK